ncbi:MAG: class I SAM-dependent methyltransferase [Chloroflexi bacterium]|nr:class I SAM-dependent methyltransferase [Chloroflexota bacterium]
MHAVPGAPQPGLSSGALAYDAIAATYDAQVQGDLWMRTVLHRHYAHVFKPGARVLDVGCGTGIDAVYLARRGISVLAIDFSPEMIAQCRARVASAGLEHAVQSRILSVHDLGSLSGERFDGLISAFAGLSTLPDLRQFAVDAYALVRPHGRLILHLLNRFSLWEWLGYVAHGDWPSAGQVGRRTTRDFTIGGRAVRHSLYFPHEAYRRFFRDHFVLRGAYALGSVRPPHTVRRVPPVVVKSLQAVDLRTGHWPLVQNAGRFWVLDLERLSA